MRVQINDKWTVFPSSLREFTLGQRIAFHEQYGRELDAWVERILSMSDDTARELETMEYQIEKCFRTFAFFAGCTPESLKESEFIDDVANIYYSCLVQVFEDESNITLQDTYHWNNTTWVLHPPELKHGSKMSFGELIESKQIVKDLIELGAGRWEILQKLCAIYLRQVDEEYDESFLYDNSDRQRLMLELPMDIALSVGFFLRSSMSLFQNTFRSSDRPEQNPPASTLIDTLSVGVG